MLLEIGYCKFGSQHASECISFCNFLLICLWLHCFCTQRERYIVTYNPLKNKVCALLKDQAKSEDILKAAFHASDFKSYLFIWIFSTFQVQLNWFSGSSLLQSHVLLHSIQSSVKNQISSGKHYEHDSLNSIAMPANIESRVADTCNMVSSTYGLFKYKPAELVTWTQHVYYASLIIIML